MSLFSHGFERAHEQAHQRAQEHFEAYERTGVYAELAAAVAGFRALSVSDMDGAVANGLALALWSRYERAGNRADLDEAIGLLRDAVRWNPFDAERLPSYLSNLAGTLRLRWRFAGVPADLIESVDVSRRALEATPRQHRKRPARLNNLGDGLLALYQYHADSSALDDALELFRAAVQTADVHTDVLVYARSNLAEALRLRFRASRDVALLDEAVVLACAAAAQAPSRPLQARFQSNLALTLLTRHSVNGRSEDLRAAAKLATKALGQTPADHPNRAERTAVLAEIRRSALVASIDPADATPRRYVPRTRLPSRWRRAVRRLIAATEAAVRDTPRGHPSRASALYWHGLAQGLRGDDDAAIALCRQVAEEPDFPAQVRVAAARQWAYVELGRGNWDEALSPFELAVDLLPRTAPRRVTQADREQALATFAGLASDAAACAIEVGKPRLAVALLEQGRGVMVGHRLDARTDLVELEGQHPELARRFEEGRTALDRPEGSSFITESTADAALSGEQRHVLSEEWHRLIEEIRSCPGFARFLRPPDVDELVAAAAQHGPVVFVNVSALRCDALLLRDREIVVVPLPDLKLADLAARAGRFELRPAHEIEELLGWLGEVVTGPVLRALDLGRAAADDEPPCLWWIPTGPLAAMPLHAAGEALDRVVSSYAPTLRGLSTAWATEPITRDRPAPLVVAVPSAPGMTHLPAAEQEAAEVARRFPDASIVNGDLATRQTVLDVLPRHRWVHFACHATSAADGRAGSLVLADHATAPLTVVDIARLRLTQAELAYLSACQTSTSGVELADEALHITGACHMAGFRHVIGTLWQVGDQFSLELAQHFYDALDSVHMPASALRTAVRRLRDSHPPARWAAFVHVGR